MAIYAQRYWEPDYHNLELIESASRILTVRDNQGRFDILARLSTSELY